MPDPAAAVRAVRAYRMLAEPLVARWPSACLSSRSPWGWPCSLGVFVRTAAIAAAVLLVVFVAAVGSARARGLQIDCGCFGNGGQVAAGETAYPSRSSGTSPCSSPRSRSPGARRPASPSPRTSPSHELKEYTGAR